MEDDPDAEQWLTVAESVCCDANSHIFCFWSYPAFTDGWFLGLMVSDMVSFLPRHFTERGNVHRRRGERPGEVRSASVAPALHLRFRPHG